MTTKTFTVKVHMLSQSEPVVLTGVRNTYQKGDMFCVMLLEGLVVQKFPIVNIFRVTEIPREL